MNTDTQSSNNNKWIWIGLGASALFCLCAVLVAVLVFRQAGQKIQEGIKTDPESASQAAHAIADYTLPAGYQERMSMNILFYSFVMIGPGTYTTNEPLIMLAQFNASGADPEQMKEQIRRSFEQQAGSNGVNMDLVEIKKMTIRGEETDVAIYEGSDQNGKPLKQLITSFTGKDGTAMLMIMGSPEYWDEK